MKHHSLTWRRVVVPAAFLAAAVCGVAGPAQAESGPGHGSVRGHEGTTTSSPASPRTDTAHATSKSGDGATTFDKPNSWQAQADPDGSTNGGVDQPGGTGGTIGKQDGNNGSGNDADCEDDNRGVGVPGHCKPKPHQLARDQHANPVHEAAQRDQSNEPGSPNEPNEPGEASHAGGPVLVPGSAAGPAHRPEAVTAAVEPSRPSAPAAQILGISAVRPRNHPVRAEVAGLAATAPAASLRPSAQTLPNTGAPGLAVPLAGAGALLVAGGAGVMLRRRTATSRS